MKNTGVVLLFSILSGFITECSNRIDPWPIDNQLIAYYKNSHQECRRAFIDECQKYSASGSILNSISISDSNLFDYFFVASDSQPGTLLILSSGVHGIEGFTGSAIQRMFIHEILPLADHKTNAYLFLHGINSWGMKHRRRVTEHNIDLNRNFDTASAIFKSKNDGYRKLNSFLNPEKVADLWSFNNLFFIPRTLFVIARYSMKSARQAALQGQYEFENGIYYGGNSFEPHVAKLKDLLKSLSGPYKNIVLIDLHTGYGERGVLHLFGPNLSEPSSIQQVENFFYGQKINWPDQKNYYVNFGDFGIFVRNVLNGKNVIPMSFECGSLNSQTLFGSIKSMKAIILENQGERFGYKTKSTMCRIKKDFDELFYPASLSWRSEILRQNRSIFKELEKKLRTFTTD